ncbi:MAG: LacI family transcriptional regulator [Glaciihabitans sp.]|nr:LacI family transcriptional regulator [Glaciihabitans sp.]
MTDDVVTPIETARIGDVARVAGVSKATVSRVMNSIRSVNPEIAAHVRAVAEQLNYVPSDTARSLSLGVTKTIGMIVPDLANPMFQQILHSLNRAAAGDGYQVLVADAQESAEAEPGLVLGIRRRSDAVVLCAPRMGPDRLAEVLLAVGPAVVINRQPVAGVSTPSISVDYAAGITALLDHLVGLGHRHLLFLSGPSQSASNRARQDGLAEFVAAHPDLRIDTVPCGSGLDDGYRAWEAVKENGATAVLAFNDIVAIGFMGRLREVGVNVPGDLTVVGFDDIDLARFASPPLTTMTVPQGLMGEAAWLQLLHQLEGKPTQRDTVFTPELVARESSAAPRG